jgi:hypothetical protein
MELEQGTSQATASSSSYPTINEISQMEGFENAGSENSSDVSEQNDSGSAKQDVKEKEYNEPKTPQQMLEEMEGLDEESEDDDSSELEEQDDSSESYLTIKHGGEIQQLTKEQAQEYAQKGYDYTKKTQALAEERKRFDVERDAITKQIEEKWKTYQDSTQTYQDTLDKWHKWEYTLKNVKDTDPDLFAMLDDHYNNALRVLDTPQSRETQKELNYLKQTISDLKQQMEKGIMSTSDASIRENYNKEYEQLKGSHFPRLKKLGLNPDPDKIKQAWVDGEKAGMVVET